ncbi:MAG: isoaspartyl peptidase/L-asparaginase, partial [Thaumarchaeota archaeon]|nr:isoaspartyl peptidase/L-asparaginase [Nitrososphaerota archaeon]
LSGNIEMDAAIMDGRNLSCGAVGAVRNVRNPVIVARKVLDETDHSLLVGSMAEKFAKRFGLVSKVLPTAERRTKWELMQKNPPKYVRKNVAFHDTVGAVAIDIDGNIASAVSTGGLWLKLDGRVGDSAVVGAGLYAENETAGVAASGIGEAIMSVCLSKLAHDFMVHGKTAMEACRASIDYITAKKGRNTAGLIAIDANGNFGYALNTKTMIIAKLRDDMDRPVIEVLRGSTPPR